jgi:hypothetical protein
MTTNDNNRNSQDPVNRWATEHYGFDENPGTADADPRAVPGDAAASWPAAPRPPADDAARPRRRIALLASSVAGLVMVAGLGGVAIAAASADDARVGGRPGDADRGAVVRFDDGGHRAGDLGGGRR